MDSSTSIPNPADFTTNPDPLNYIRAKIRNGILKQSIYQKHAEIRFDSSPLYCSAGTSRSESSRGRQVQFFYEEWNLDGFEKVAREYLDSGLGYRFALLTRYTKTVYANGFGMDTTKYVTVEISWDPDSKGKGFVMTHRIAHE
jgi:hypothetical protein